MTVRIRRALAALAISAGIAAAAAGVAAAQAPPAKVAKLAVVSGDKVEFRVDDDAAVAHLLLRNTGTAPADARIRVLLADNSEPALTTVPATVPVGIGDVVPVQLRFDVTDRTRRSGRLVVDDRASPADEPVSVAVVVRDSPSGAGLAMVVAGGFLAAATVVGYAQASVRLPEGKTPGTYALTVDPKWSFKESWAANITAVGAVLGTVLAATDVLAGILEELSTKGFLGLNLIWGACVLLAPVAYGAYVREVDSGTGDVVVGTYKGFLWAAFFTTAGVLGQLVTLAYLVFQSSLESGAQVGLVIGLAIAAAFVARYVHRTTANAVDDAKVAEAEPEVEALREIVQSSFAGVLVRAPRARRSTFV